MPKIRDGIVSDSLSKDVVSRLLELNILTIWKFSDIMNLLLKDAYYVSFTKKNKGVLCKATFNNGLAKRGLGTTYANAAAECFLAKLNE